MLRNNKWNKFAILFLCILVITFIIFLGIRTNSEIQNIVQKQFTGQQLLLSRQISTGIENFLNERTIYIELLAKYLSDASPDRISTSFKNVYDKTSGIYVLEFVNESGNVVIGYPEKNTPIGYNIPNEKISVVLDTVKKNQRSICHKAFALT